MAALALAGVWLAITAFTVGHDDAGHASAPCVGERITTSYGSFTVEHVEDIGGLTADDLARPIPSA